MAIISTSFDCSYVQGMLQYQLMLTAVFDIYIYMYMYIYIYIYPASSTNVSI